MKKLLLILCAFALQNAVAQVGISTTIPTAQLDVSATNAGILIPRVDLTSLSVAAPVLNPNGGALPVSTLVYHKGTSGITAGYYYWDGTRWQGIGKSQEKGLQYYVFSGITGSSPNTEKSSIGGTLAYSGNYTGLLNTTAALNTVRGTLTANYVVLFTGTLVVETAGVFQFSSSTDDGSRIVIDGIPVLNRWIDQGVTLVNGSSVNLAKGKHQIEFWYYQNSGGQDMTFNWVQNTIGASAGVIDANSFIIE